MKKKIYFIISSILQIVCAIYIIVNVNTIIQTQLDTISETYAMFPIEFQERMISMLENSGEIMVIFLSIIQILLNLFVIKSAVNNSILRNKGKLIAVSVICFFFAESSIVMLVSLINFIVLLCLKRKNPEDYPTKEKKEIPHLEYKKLSKKEIIFERILVLTYFFTDFLFGVLFITQDISKTTAIVMTVVYYIVIFVLAIVCFKDRLKRDIKLFKENSKSYFQYVLPKLGIMYVIFAISNTICILLTKQATSTNQSMIEAMPLWFTIPMAIIWAPIVEESIFRGVLRRFIKNDKLFIVISAVTFGLLHTTEEATVFSMTIMAIPYAILGGFLAYIYAKTKNITTNILSHAFINTIAMLFTTLMAFIVL